MAEPLLSVLITAYQHGPYIRKCLESVVSQQTTFPFEVIVGEDGSKDDTLQICLEFAERYPDKVVVLQHGHLEKTVIRGRVTGRHNWSVALRRCRGRYFVPLDGDDYWTDPTKLQRQVDFLEQNPSYSFVCHDMRRIRNDGRELAPGPRTRLTELRIEDVMEYPIVPTVTVVYRRSTLPDPMPRWMLEEAPVVDYPMAVLASVHGPGRRLERTMAVYRVGIGNWTTRRRLDLLRDAVCTRQLLARELPETHRPAMLRQVARAQLILAHTLAISGEMDEARQVFASVDRSSLSFPRDLTRWLPTVSALRSRTVGVATMKMRSGFERSRNHTWRFVRTN